jgi:hypothetical protein
VGDSSTIACCGSRQRAICQRGGRAEWRGGSGRSQLCSVLAATAAAPDLPVRTHQLSLERTRTATTTLCCWTGTQCIADSFHGLSERFAVGSVLACRPLHWHRR